MSERKIQGDKNTKFCRIGIFRIMQVGQSPDSIYSYKMEDVFDSCTGLPIRRSPQGMHQVGKL